MFRSECSSSNVGMWDSLKDELVIRDAKAIF